MRGRVALTCHQCGAAGSAGAGREARAGGGGVFVERSGGVGVSIAGGRAEGGRPHTPLSKASLFEGGGTAKP